MLRDNSYLIKTLNLIDILQEEFSIEFDSTDKYASIVKKLSKMTSFAKCNEEKDTFKLKKEMRATIEEYLYSMNIYKFKQKIGNFYTVMTTGFAIENEQDIPHYELDVLNDIYLLRFLTSFIQCITYVQKDDKLLVKYSKSMTIFGYNNLTNVCRGKVLDLNTKEIISYPFDKFFNLGECAETNNERIQGLLSKATYISAMDKADGSTIIITKVGDELIINTNGEFNNIQITMAKKLLLEKYQYFVKNIKENFTYVFELIHPSDKKVIDYNGEKKLLLLAIRDLKSRRLLRYDECEQVALDLKLELVGCFDFTTLDDFVHLSHTLKDSNREGWVIRIITEDEDIMFKLKIDEYCVLHRSILGSVNAFDIFELMYENTLDDAIAKADEGTKVLISDMVIKINNIMTNVENSLRNSLDIVKAKFDITQEEFRECLKDRQHPKYQERLDLIKYIHANCREYYDFEGITAYYRNGLSVEEFMDTIDLIKFKVLCRKKLLLKEEDIVVTA